MVFLVVERFCGGMVEWCYFEKQLIRRVKSSPHPALNLALHLLMVLWFWGYRSYFVGPSLPACCGCYELIRSRARRPPFYVILLGLFSASFSKSGASCDVLMPHVFISQRMGSARPSRRNQLFIPHPQARYVNQQHALHLHPSCGELLGAVTAPPPTPTPNWPGPPAHPPPFC